MKRIWHLIIASAGIVLVGACQTGGSSGGDFRYAAPRPNEAAEAEGRSAEGQSESTGESQQRDSTEDTSEERRAQTAEGKSANEESAGTRGGEEEVSVGLARRAPTEGDAVGSVAILPAPRERRTDDDVVPSPERAVAPEPSAERVASLQQPTAPAPSPERAASLEQPTAPEAPAAVPEEPPREAAPATSETPAIPETPSAPEQPAAPDNPPAVEDSTAAEDLAAAEDPTPAENPGPAENPTRDENPGAPRNRSGPAASDAASDADRGASVQRSEAQESPESRRAPEPVAVAPPDAAEGGSGRSASGDQVVRQEEVSTPVDTRFTVRLPGSGWIYLGSAEGSSNVRFEGRESSAEDTQFQFKVSAPGDYELQFQRQDSVQGDVSRRTVPVHASDAVAGTTEGEATAGAATGAGGGQAPGTGNAAGEQQPRSDFDEAYRLLESGEREAALDRFLSTYRGPNAEVALDIADLAESLGRSEEARRFYETVAEADSTPALTTAAEAGLFRIAAANEAWSRADRYSESALDSGASPAPETVLALGEHRAEENPAGAIEIFERYLSEAGSASRRDWVHYMLGRLYERQSEARNMAQALHNYQAVKEMYPLSDYYDSAVERIRYIERYYVDIR